MIRRLPALVLLSVLLVVGLTACSKGQRDRKDLLAALTKTQQLSGQFIYDEHASGTETVVKGIIADDYRYKAQVVVDGQPKVEEVVADDSIADLFLQPSAVALLARRSADGKLLTAPLDDTSPTASGLSVLDALASQRWVLDPTGAPDAFTSAAKHPVGQDPVYDARNVFAYVNLALLQAARVTKYDSESISPTFKTKDDPFPKPKHGSKLIRYDLEPRAVPRKNSTTSGANQAVPDVANFRRMVVFVENGLVVRVMEDTTLTWKLGDLKRNYSLSLSGTPDEQAAAALAGINAVRVGQGTEALRPRTLDFQVVNSGQPFDVALPTTAVIGPLHLLVNRGASTTASLTPTFTTTPSTTVSPDSTTAPTTAP